MIQARRTSGWGDVLALMIFRSELRCSSVTGKVLMGRDMHGILAEKVVLSSYFSGSTLVVLGKSGGLVQKRARLVWTSGDTLTGPDLALLHADLQPRAYFLFAKPEKVQPGDLVAATGWSQLNPATRSTGMAAGRLVKISPLRQGPGGFAWRRIDHNVPFNAGDSGGPLVCEQGLAGINARAWPGWTGAVRVMLHLDGPLDRPFPGYAAWSFAPDHAWLERTIEQDRAARRAVKH